MKPFYTTLKSVNAVCTSCNKTAGQHESFNGWCPTGWPLFWSETSKFSSPEHKDEEPRQFLKARPTFAVKED